MTQEEIVAELRHLATKEEVASLRAGLNKDFGDFRAEMQKQFGDFRAQVQKELGDFKADVLKTLWLTQLSVAGVILVGVGLIANLALGPINGQLSSLASQVQSLSARLPQK
jgi:hypothetical protein